MTSIPDTSQNSSFSKLLPGMQIALDATSLEAFRTCPRKYQYRVMMGVQEPSRSVHLTFGILLHGAHERYCHARVSGTSHDEALASALRWAMVETWDKALGRPRDMGLGLRGKPTNKNRLTLLRTIVWWMDGLLAEDAFETLRLADGRAAVELPFSFDSGYLVQSTGERVMLCGHLDRIGVERASGQAYILDVKTTEHTIGPHWFKQFTPHVQFTLYTIAGRTAFSEKVRGIVVDGLQVGATMSRPQRHIVSRDEHMLTEWLADLGETIEDMEQCAIQGHWPMNDSACDRFGGCPYREICSHSPVSRERWLVAGGFTKGEAWDPLARRGDI